jgi:hypothetical protein
MKHQQKNLTLPRMTVVATFWIEYMILPKRNTTSVTSGTGFEGFLSLPSPAVVNRRTDNTMPKIKVQKEKQRSTKHYTENKD